MKQYPIILSILILGYRLWGQTDTDNIQKYLIGDWYFFDKDSGNCSLDSTYYEIVFDDSTCSSLEYANAYKIIGNKIFFGSTIESLSQTVGELIILDSNKFRINFKERSLVYHKIISDDYKLSDQIHDNDAFRIEPHVVVNRF